MSVFMSLGFALNSCAHISISASHCLRCVFMFTTCICHGEVMVCEPCDMSCCLSISPTWESLLISVEHGFCQL